MMFQLAVVEDPEALIGKKVWFADPFPGEQRIRICTGTIHEASRASCIVIRDDDGAKQKFTYRQASTRELIVAEDGVAEVKA